jgi:hypothetical protein
MINDTHSAREMFHIRGISFLIPIVLLPVLLIFFSNTHYSAHPITVLVESSVATGVVGSAATSTVASDLAKTSPAASAPCRSPIIPTSLSLLPTPTAGSWEYRGPSIAVFDPPCCGGMEPPLVGSSSARVGMAAPARPSACVPLPSMNGCQLLLN